MNTHLSDQLIATRDALRTRSRSGLFLFPCGLRSLVKRMNTFIALAEELEDELHLAELRQRRDDALQGCRILRLPMGSAYIVKRMEEDGAP